MKNAQELTDILSENVKELIAGTRSVGIAKEVNNACGKRLSIVKLQLQQNEHLCSKTPIEFLESK